MIAVVDYCKGNLRSVERGLIDADGDARITDSPADIASAAAIVLPGVGAFADASATMFSTGQMEALREALAQGKPFMGICLGLHLLFEAGTEGAPGKTTVEDMPDQAVAEDDQGQVTAEGTSAQLTTEGIGLIPGVVDRMPEYDASGVRYKVPHVGWDSIDFSEDVAHKCPLLQGIKPGEYFYFTHSYIAPENPYTLATTTHSVTFPSVVQKGDTIFGLQFHPEKSSDVGAQIMKNFVRLIDSQRVY